MSPEKVIEKLPVDEITRQEGVFIWLLLQATGYSTPASSIWLENQIKNSIQP